MIKKIAAMLAIFSFVTVSAAVPQQSLKSAVNNLNYALSVEWDQTDKEFYNDTVKNFQDTILELTKQGMKKEELMNGVIDSIHNKRIAQEIRQQMKLIDYQEMTSEEAIDFVTDKIKLTHADGASYTGRTLTKHLIILGLIAGVLIALHCDNNAFDNKKCWEFRDSL